MTTKLEHADRIAATIKVGTWLLVCEPFEAGLAFEGGKTTLPVGTKLRVFSCFMAEYLLDAWTEDAIQVIVFFEDYPSLEIQTETRPETKTPAISDGG